MANLFDTANAPEGMPSAITVAAFVQWKLALITADYPNDLYTVEFICRLRGGTTTEFIVSSTVSGDDYLFTLDGSEALTAGDYNWQQVVTQTSTSYKILLESGTVKVVADLNTESADLRSHAAIMVDKIESLLVGKADADVSSYSIAGRSLTKMTFQELIQNRDYYKREAAKEANDAALAAGKGGSSTIKVRF